ncbi:hypothetical protein [Brachybacterium kimchii]|uniref:Uncharacterized protein n=1 Tax=Brachybacterium kimchii TaxID=2942909 RepID=A0ABY4NA12_9MICO|nr:hypothetical protein [Brachybacterium kimchii]UQN30637.1 hypothetical protein M4486_04870 [Brachybacterium kimchii]
MHQHERSSNATGGLRVDVYWLSCSSSEEREHVAAAVDALFEAIRGSGTRLWSPYSKAYVRATFKKRIEKASRGELRPRSELKPVSDGRVPLYEIRWSDIDVLERPEEGADEAHRKVSVRLLHGEPAKLGVCIVGIRAHEKFVAGTDGENKRAQDREIEQALAEYLRLEAAGWPVTPRT